MTDFKDTYISASDKLIDDKSKKKVLSDDAYAICECMEKIFVQLFRGARRG